MVFVSFLAVFRVVGSCHH